jgi:transcriptional regulator with XRE-family HTH domain
MTTTITIEWDERKAIEWALAEDGETQNALAAKVGIDPGVLSRLLSGQRKNLDVALLKRIADAQNRPLDFYMEVPSVEAVPASTPRYVNLEWFERLIPDLPPPATLAA